MTNCENAKSDIFAISIQSESYLFLLQNSKGISLMHHPMHGTVAFPREMTWFFFLVPESLSFY